MKVYQGDVKRGVDSWIATLHGLPGDKSIAIAATWTKLNVTAKELIAHRTGEAADSFLLVLKLTDPRHAQAIEEMHEARRAARKANAEYQRALTHAAKSLCQVMSTREAGEVLGYSHQRIAKLVKSVPGE